MSDVCKTVKVKADNEAGFIVINESDVTLDHEIHDQEAEAKAKAEAKTKAEAEAKANKDKK